MINKVLISFFQFNQETNFIRLIDNSYTLKMKHTHIHQYYLLSIIYAIVLHLETKILNELLYLRI